MSDLNLQKFCAYGTLFLMPFPAFNFGVSFTYADALLLMAIVLNAHELMQLHMFQVFFLLAAPFFFISGMLDADGDLVSTIQLLYIWGILLPFGWVAFASLPRRSIALVLLSSAAINSAVGVAQFAGWMPVPESSQVIYFGTGSLRAPGLTVACNSLAQLLTPCALLLPNVRRAGVRLVVLVLLIAGMLSTISKAVLLAIPGILFYLWREPQKHRLTQAFLGLVLLLFMVFVSGERHVVDVVENFVDAVEHRFEYSEKSLDDRSELVDIAMEYVPDCLLWGYGAAGSRTRVGQRTGNAVHVYYIGAILIAGFPGAILLMVGMGKLVFDLLRLGEIEIAAFMTAHMLALSVATVMYLSFQSLPVMVAGAALATATQRQRQTADARELQPHLRRNGLSNARRSGKHRTVEQRAA